MSDDGGGGRVYPRFEVGSVSGDPLRVIELRGVERISQQFRYELRIETDAYGVLTAEEVLLKPASIAWVHDSGEVLHRVEGIVSEFRDQVDADDQFPRVHVTVSPRAYVATQFETLDVFLEESVPAVVEKCLARRGLKADEDFDLGDLADSYPEREFIVQYKESDANFTQRLCEQIGIHFHFDDEGKMVFGDTNVRFGEISRIPQVDFRPVAGVGYELDRVTALETQTRNIAKSYVVRDYNWRNPGVDLMGEAEVLAEGMGQIVEYGAHFKTPDEATYLANVRAEELRATRVTYSGVSSVPNFRAGATFQLNGHPMGDTPLLLTEVVHEFTRGASEPRDGYRNYFRAIHKDTAYRPPRLTPKPVVNGLLTGIIDAPSGTEFGAVDDQGRYHVKLLFDTAERGEGQASRAIRMAGPNVGGEQGFSFPLRPNTEVVLACVNGDPDRLIITGAVPNPSTPAPVGAQNANKNIIKTQQNLIDIDDKEPRIKLSTSSEDTLLQLGQPNEPNLGIIMRTTADSISSAQKVHSVGSAAVSAWSTYQASFATKNIVQEAGPATPLKGFGKYMHFGAAAIDFASGAIGAASAVLDSRKKFADEMKSSADKAVEAKQKALIGSEEYTPTTVAVTDANGKVHHVPTESEDQWRKRRATEKATEKRSEAEALARAGQHEQAAAAARQADELDRAQSHATGWKTDADHWKGASESLSEGAMKNVTTGLGLAGTAVKGLKAGKEALEAIKEKGLGGALWGSLKKTAHTAGEVKALAKANLDVSTFKAVTQGRKGFTVVPIVAPLNLQGSSNASILTAGITATVVGRTTTQIGGGKIGILSRLDTKMASQGRIEVAARNMYLTSSKLFDVLSEGTLLVVSEKTATFQSKETTKIESKDKDVRVLAKTKFVLEAGDQIHLKSKDVKLEATDTNFLQEVKKDFVVNAKQHAKLNADKEALLHGKTKLTAKSDKGGLEEVGGTTTIWQGASKNSRLELKATAGTLKASSKLDFNASTINVQGTTINVKGRVLLG